MNRSRKTTLRGIAALTAVLLGAAGAAGVDQMATVHPQKPTAVAAQATSDGQQSLHQLVKLGLAKGSLPGGFPFDEPREEEYDENHQETLFLSRSHLSDGPS